MMEKNYGSHIDFPSNWKVERLKDNFSIYPTASYSRADLTEDGPVKYIHYGDIHTQYDFHLDVQKNNLPRITEEQIKKYQLVEEGDLIIADASEDYEGVGKAVEVINLDNEKVIAGLHTFLIRDNAKIFAPKFKGYALLSSYVREQMYRLATGTKVYSISKESLKDIKIPLPPIEEQNAIANCLSTWDEAIEKQQKLIEAKEIRHKGLMQKLLSGKKRLPGFTDEWKEVKLGEYINKIQNGYAFDAKSYLTNGIPIVTMGSINLSGEFTLNKSRCNFWAKDEKLERYFLNDGDLIIAMTDVTPDKNLIGLTVIVQTDEVLYLNQRVGKLVLNSSYLDPKFIAYLSLNPNWRNQCKAFATLGVQANISTNDICNIKISLPTLQEQQSIVEILNFTEKEIKNERLKIRILKEQKKALMQKLLTGKIRLPLNK